MAKKAGLKTENQNRCSVTGKLRKNIKTYTLNWGDGDLTLDDLGLKDYLMSESIFSDEDIKAEPQELTVTIAFKYTEAELRALPEFDF